MVNLQLMPQAGEQPINLFLRPFRVAMEKPGDFLIIKAHYKPQSQ
jgi:hypothetical protein